MGRLDALDLSLRLSKEEEAQRLDAGGRRLAWLRLQLAGLVPYADGTLQRGPALCVVFEGWDASGKGGAIKRLVAHLDPRHVQYAYYAAPSEEERHHHYLRRFWVALPAQGGMTVFDRSWYGRVLVERVEGFATEEQWRRGYEEIDAFEKMLVDDRTILVKLWLHVSAEEQRRRFEARAKDPFKRFKLTDADWRNLALRPRYEQAVEDMLARTDTAWAPWTLVEGDAKRWARVKALESTIAAVEAGLRRWGLAPGPLPGDG